MNKSFLGVVAVVVIGFALVGCNKPSEGDCRRAVQRIRELTGTSHEDAKTEVETAVRSCRGNSKKASVQCAIEASSLDQLERCGMLTRADIDELQREQAAEAAAKADAGPAAAPPPADAGAAPAATDGGAAPAATTDAGSATTPTTAPPAPAGTVGGAAK